jgi:hypothetical protein
MSMGIKLTRTGICVKASSYLLNMPPEIMPENMSTVSQTILFLASSQDGVFR